MSTPVPPEPYPSYVAPVVVIPVADPVPPGFVAVVGVLRDDTGVPLEGLLVVDNPFGFKSSEPGIVLGGRSSLFLVAGQAFKDQAGVTPGVLPVTPAGYYLKFFFKPADGTSTERNLGVSPIPAGGPVDLAALLGS